MPHAQYHKVILEEQEKNSNSSLAWSWKLSDLKGKVCARERKRGNVTIHVREHTGKGDSLTNITGQSSSY